MVSKDIPRLTGYQLHPGLRWICLRVSHGKPDVTSSSRSALALEPQRVREHARVFTGASLATPLKTGDILGFVTAAFVQLLWSPADVRRHPFAPAIRPFSPRRSHGVCTDDLAARFRAIGIAPCRDPSINRVQNQQQPSVDERSLPNPCFKDNCRQIVKDQPPKMTIGRGRFQHPCQPEKRYAETHFGLPPSCPQLPLRLPRIFDHAKSHRTVLRAKR